MIKKHLPTALSIVTILILWQAIALSLGYPAIFPTLDLLFVESFRVVTTAGFYEALSATIFRGFIGFLISFILALSLGSLAAHIPFWKKFLHPIIVVIRSVPVISVVLIALLWFSPNELPVFIALLTMFPILYQSVLNGFEHVDLRLVEMSIIFGRSRWNTFVNIYLPSAKMLITGGISTASGFGWRAIIIGEVLAQPPHGIGSSMKAAQVYLNVSELFAWTLAAIIISYLFDILIQYISKINFTHTLKQAESLTQNNFSTKKISVQNLKKSYGSQCIFDGFYFEFSSDKVYLLKTPSGTGKTTLLRLLSGILKPDAGKITFENCRKVAYSFQDGRLCNWLTAEQNVRYGIHNSKNNNALSESELQEMMEQLEIRAFLQKHPKELSGGQQQRIALARALAAKPDLLLLDEPLNGLDSALKMKIMEFINSYIAGYKPLVIWATHEEVKLTSMPSEEVRPTLKD